VTCHSAEEDIPTAVKALGQVHSIGGAGGGVGEEIMFKADLAGQGKGVRVWGVSGGGGGGGGATNTEDGKKIGYFPLRQRRRDEGGGWVCGGTGGVKV